MIATTIEQSRHLLELGLDPSTADMAYICGAPESLNVADDYYLKDIHDEYDTPAWSLSALLEVMPKSFKRWCLISNMKDYYWCTFEQNDGFIIKEFYAENPVTAAYQMVCWLLENDLIKKGGEQ